MPEQEAKEILVQFAELRQKMTSVNNSVEEIKASVKEVLILDRTIAGLSIHQKQTSKQIQAHWERIDKTQKAVEAVDKKADEWINKGRGAWFTLMLIGSLAQALVLWGVVYTFNHLRTAEDTILIMNQRISQLEIAQHKDVRP